MDEDAYILNLLFRYKILEYKNSYKCGFPDNVINKVLNTLEDKHISYRIYCADGKIIEKLFKLNNKYEKYKKEALSIAAEKAKIDMIINKLKIASEDDLKKIMEYIESCLE